MKLAEVATSPEFWNPDDHPPKQQNGDSDLSASTTSKEMQCNGHQEGGEEKKDDGDGGEDEMKPEVVMGNGAGGAEDAASLGVPPFEFTAEGGEQMPHPPQLPSSLTQKPAVDPVTEVCLDLQVKIADLGNACWVVRA